MIKNLAQREGMNSNDIEMKIHIATYLRWYVAFLRGENQTVNNNNEIIKNILLKYIKIRDTYMELKKGVW